MVDEIKTNNEVFDELDDETDSTSEALKEVNTDEIFGELSDKPKFDKVLKPEDNNKVYTIIKTELRKPYTKDAMGKLIPPKQTVAGDTTKSGYPSSLSVFLKDTDYVINLSGITYYVKKVSPTVNEYNPWFNMKVKEELLDDQYTSAISRLFFKYCKFKKLDMAKVTAKAFKDGIIGMKVKCRNKKGSFKGKEFEKIEVVDFVE